MKKADFKALSALTKIKVLSSSFDSKDLVDMESRLAFINIITAAEFGSDGEKAFLDETIERCFQNEDKQHEQPSKMAQEEYAASLAKED